jgi:hypothetical protein
MDPHESRVFAGSSMVENDLPYHPPRLAGRKILSQKTSQLHLFGECSAYSRPCMWCAMSKSKALVPAIIFIVL